MKEYDDNLEYGFVYTESELCTLPFKVGFYFDNKVYVAKKKELKQVTIDKFYKHKRIKYCLSLYLTLGDYQLIHYRLDKLSRKYKKCVKKYKYMFANPEYLFTYIVFGTPYSSQDVAKFMVQKIV